MTTNALYSYSPVELARLKKFRASVADFKELISALPPEHRSVDYNRQFNELRSEGQALLKGSFTDDVPKASLGGWGDAGPISIIVVSGVILALVGLGINSIILDDVLINSLGCAVTDLGILADEAEIVRGALERAAADHDLILTTGGVSVGEEDHVKAAVESLGRLHAWRLAIKPGRPLALGQVARVPFIGLPGNPVAVMVTFLTIARPAILRLMGAEDLEPHRFKVAAGFDFKKKKDRREWLRVKLAPDNGGWRAEIFPRQGSGILSSLVEADGLVELPEDLTRLERGAMVDFLPFSEVT